MSWFGGRIMREPEIDSGGSELLESQFKFGQDVKLWVLLDGDGGYFPIPAKIVGVAFRKPMLQVSYTLGFPIADTGLYVVTSEWRGNITSAEVTEYKNDEFIEMPAKVSPKLSVVKTEEDK